jgi:hypothetical protein
VLKGLTPAGEPRVTEPLGPDERIKIGQPKDTYEKTRMKRTV